MKKLLPIIIVLLFFQTIVIVNATPPLKSVNHLYNFDLMPVDDSEIEIKKAMLTFDLRKMSDSFSPEAELKAQYTIINKGETRSVKLALPFLADYDEASDFFLQNLNINNNYLEPMLYVGDWCEDYISHGENEVEIDFKNEFSEATNRNYSVPELSGWLYKFKIPPGNSEVYLKAEFEPGMKFVLENNQFSPFSNYLHTTFYPPFDKEDSYIYVLGDPNNLHFTTEDDITIIKEEMNFIDFFEEYLEEPDHYLKDLIIKHNIKKFLASDESAINQWDIKYYGYKRLWFQVLEPELLGDNIENILKFSYKVTGFINERYSPSIYEFRYYLSSTRYWNDYSNLTVRVYPMTR
ncbi:MAG: hypothetical protein ACOX43_00615 [Bacilli bacterium]|jgi:hypothetical protein